MTLDVLILTPVEDSALVVTVAETELLPGRKEGDEYLCPDTAVTLGELVLMLFGTEALCPGAENVVGVLGPAMPDGVTNL